MAYGLGVDLGTTYSAAAVGRDGRVEAFTLGTTAAAIPSVVVLREDGEVLVGEAAERRSATEPTRTAREFKRRLGDSTPIVVGGTPYGAEALMAHLLRSIVKQVTEREGAAPDHIALTHPANYAQFKKDLLHEAARLAGLDMARVSLLTEPEAAAINYAGQQRVETGQVVAVYDFGGGTFDAAVVRKTPDGFEIVGVPEGIERLGGIDIDAAILAHVDSALDGQLRELDSSDPAVRSALARLRDECRRAKESLSTDTDTSIPVAVPGLQTEVRLTRAELEAMIRPRLRETVEALERAVGSAGITMADVSRVLLVGGTSRIPLIGELLREATGRPVALDAHPKFAIASGAAVEAGRVAAEREAEALAATAAMAAPAAASTDPGPTAAPSAARASSPDAGAPAKRGGLPILPIAIGAVVLAVVAGAAFMMLGQGSAAQTASPATAASPGSSTAVVTPPSDAPATEPASAPASTEPSDAPPSAPASPSDAPLAGPGSGIVSAVAGIGTSGNDPLAGEGGPANAAKLNLANGIASAPNGDLFIADTNTSRLLQITDSILSVAYRGDFSAGENDVSGVAVAPDGTVAFTTGQGIRTIPAGGGAPTVLSSDPAVMGTAGTQLAYGPDGILYVGTGRFSPRVFRVEADGSLTPVAGTGATTGASSASSGPAVNAAIGRLGQIAVDSQGRVSFADESLGVVKRVETDGSLVTLAGGGTLDPRTGQGAVATDLLLQPVATGVAVDDQDRVYVSGGANGQILRVEDDGTANFIASDGRSTELGKPAIETGFHFPHRLAMSPTGDLLVVLEGGSLIWQVAGVASN